MIESRLFKLQVALLREIDFYEDRVTRKTLDADWERVHISSCARLGYILGEKRGLDPDFAACACAIHDYGRIVTGRQKDHAEKGYELVGDFLRKTNLFTEEEVEILRLAVKNHSSKAEIGTPIEEIVKDADVVDFYQYGLPFARQEQEDRYKNMLSKGEL